MLFQLTVEAVKIKKETVTKILVNDRADVAFSAGADGVHLTSNSISTEVIRQSFPRDLIIGVSTHKVSEVLEAKKKGADFAVFSPIFFTPSKEKYGKPQSVNNLAKVIKAVENFPVFGLGGINQENFGEVLQAGAKGIAAIRLLNDNKKLPQIVKMIKEFRKENG